MNYTRTLVSGTLGANKFTLFVAVGYAIALVSWLPDLDENKRTFSSLWSNTDYYFDPILSHYFSYFLQHYIAVDISVLLLKVIFPMLILLLSVNIFKRFVQENWACLLALVGISFLHDYPVRAFIFDLLQTSEQTDISLGPVLTSHPFPGFTVLCALVTFSMCSKQHFVDVKKACICTLAISCMFYVHALTAGFMFAFWFVFYGVRCSRQCKTMKSAVAHILLQLGIFSVAVLFAIFNADFTAATTPNSKLTVYFAVIYWFVPVALTVLIHIIRRIDIADTALRFSPVFIMMFLEFFVIFLDFFDALPLNFDYVHFGFSQIFLHSFYYMPSIYYLSRGHHDYSRGLEATKLAKIVSLTIENVFISFEKFLILPILVFLLIYQCKWVYHFL